MANTDTTRMLVIIGAAVAAVGLAVLVNSCASEAPPREFEREPAREVAEVCQDNTQIYRLGDQLFVDAHGSGQSCGATMDKLSMSPEQFCRTRGGTSGNPVSIVERMGLDDYVEEEVK